MLHFIEIRMDVLRLIFYATQMMCQPPLEKTLSYYLPPMSMAPVGLACLLECFEYNNNATQPVSFYSESDS